MPKKKTPQKKKTLHSRLAIGTAVAAATLAAGTLFWFSAGNGKILVPSYRALYVIDGDTFETTDHQRIRVASIDSPSLENCGGKEAKVALEKMILNKPLYIKVNNIDPYHRLVALVYTDEKFVNVEMIKTGHAYYYRGSKGEIGESLEKASEDARQKKIGIFSKKCTQMINPKNNNCNIKGNIAKEKIYYVPECKHYSITSVDLYMGDQWFCNEKDAQNAGFRKPKTC